MENLKEFLKNVLSFAKTINPNCRPLVVFSSNDETKKKLVELEILKLTQPDIQKIVDYFSDLVQRISWAEDADFNLHFSCSPVEITACSSFYVDDFSKIKLSSGKSTKEDIRYGIDELLF